MPYVRKSNKSRGTPKVFKSNKSLRKSAWKKSVAQIAKTVALREQETKTAHRNLGTNYTLNHNGWDRVSDNLLYTTQGTNDGSHRIGDQITLRGLKIYGLFESLADTPNVNVRFMIYKVRKEWADSTIAPVKPITSYAYQNPADMEKVMKVVLDKRFKLTGQSSVVGLVAPPTVPEEPIDNRRVSHFKSWYIPLNNVKYTYDDSSFVKGRDYQYACWMTAWLDSTTSTDYACAKASISSELFFKDG